MDVGIAIIVGAIAGAVVGACIGGGIVYAGLQKLAEAISKQE